MDNSGTSAMQLVLAFLNLGIDDACLDPFARNQNRRLREEARRWIESDADRPFSFVWCMHVAGLGENIERVRLAIQEDPRGLRRRLRRRKVPGGRPPQTAEWPQLGVRVHRAS